MKASNIGGNIYSTSNDEFRFVEYFPKDADQMEDSDRRQYLSSIASSFMAMNDDESLSFYKTLDTSGERFFLKSYTDNSFPFELTTNGYALEDCNILGHVDGEFSIEDGYIYTGLEYLKLIRLNKLSNKSITECYLDQYSNDYVVSVKKISNIITEKKLNARYSENTEIANNNLKPKVKNQLAARDALSRLHDVEEDQICHFDVQIWLIAKASTKSECDSRVRKIVSSLKRKRHSFFVEKHSLDLIVGEIHPLEKSSFSYSFEIDNQACTLLVPSSRDYIHETGVPFHSAHGNFEPVFYDIFSKQLSNYNSLVTGMSGQGKSFLSCHLAYYSKLQYGENLSIGFYDVGGALDKVAQYLGGKRFDGKINPFLIKEPIFLRDLIVSIIGKDEVNKKAKGELLTLVRENIDSCNSFKELIYVIDKKITLITDFLFYFSDFWDFFTDEEVLIPSVFYLDVKAVPDDLQFAYMLFVRTLVKSQNTRVLNMYDESWHFLKQFPELLLEDAKTGRKAIEANWFFTQQINELAVSDSDVCDAIIGNCGLKVYFHQPSIKSGAVKKPVKEKVDKIITVRDQYSEFIFETATFTKVLRLYRDELIYELALSEKEDVAKQQKFLEKALQQFNYKKSFDLYVRSIYGL